MVVWWWWDPSYAHNFQKPFPEPSHNFQNHHPQGKVFNQNPGQNQTHPGFIVLLQISPYKQLYPLSGVNISLG
jgi:hypothetical protein